MLSDDVHKVITFAKSVIPLVSQIKNSLKMDGPMHSAMDVGSNKKKTVKRYPKRMKCKLNTSFAKGGAKAQQRAKARALATAKLDPNYVEKSLGPNLFDTDSDSEQSKSVCVPSLELNTWSLDTELTESPSKEESAVVKQLMQFPGRNSKRNIVDI